MEKLKRIFEIIDEIIPLNIEVKKEEREILSAPRVLKRPVKREEDTSNDNNTSEEESKTLPERNTSIPYNKTAIEERSETRNT